ncbi:glycerol-3-phosphate 1-O-acyltransferase PlsY [Anoxybacillus sp. LAT_35]|uniref:glycerol-3-phosphate 1-O-acyltransferase PlsY n=1 Tax=Anoxybacillus TaxID=150247 RepID=UPI001EE9F3DD|nr:MULTISPECIES: glycerol-3-phosphate 1-O-acyltransferase PlsY [Anoxybacillus]MCG6196364.1 glycerol-3-phosphate 1-O-acyltransferase PlsY [Anoxybacillus sp. LAT_38]MCG6171022.1 glycerol-3-phosphate 1-O-acyltransferase PlsY [Anoxybacillus sp. LAT_11]MCG6178295.1 glycerol-3-phosphate 1-O-acyltransferase PlsY [Anoxybacillus sp. LAT_35]MCG6183415.1 glycerol-3-phosphate 1-O-acyltransferase PlsY [Anoxybacillus sp. LAT_26]MCL9971187.1 glycerol-3-phosphate 1-O-acyltransferase PlsY [Anoxybacillus kestan
MSVLLVIFGYLLGSIPFALIVGKVGYGIDIREHGSGNLGGTNTFRVLGVKAGLIVTIADILKGTLAASLPILFSIDIHPLLTGMFAVFGHTYPVFAQFRGGKAVATSGGVLLFYSPVLFMTMLAVFFLILYISKYVSLSSMLTGVYATAYAFIWTDDVPLRIVVTLLTLFVFYRHRANIKRILNKTEPKVKWL